MRARARDRCQVVLFQRVGDLRLHLRGAKQVEKFFFEKKEAQLIFQPLPRLKIPHSAAHCGEWARLRPPKLRSSERARCYVRALEVESSGEKNNAHWNSRDEWARATVRWRAIVCAPIVVCVCVFGQLRLLLLLLLLVHLRTLVTVCVCDFEFGLSRVPVPGSLR